MKETDNVALVDMDGTLADFHNQLEHDLNRVLGKDRDKVSAKTIREVEWLIRRDGGWYRNLKPLPLGFEIVRVLQSVGFRIMIMTKSSKEAKNAWSEKAAWISEYLPEAEMTVTQDKALVYGKVLVDDYPTHFLRWMERRPRGKVIMPVQPWNCEVMDRDNLHPVKTKEDAEKLRPMLNEVFKRGLSGRTG